MGLLTSNIVKKLITANVGVGDTTINVTDVVGLPDVSDPADYTIVTLGRASDGLYEIVKVTGTTTNTLTVERSQEGTSALTFSISDEMINVFTSGMFDQINIDITAAEAAETGALAAQVAAELAETNAAASETNAATSASNASTSETNAATSETNAGTSASNAGTSETNAATSASNAGTSETNAGTSETSAAASAAASLVSETNAATSASNASTSETNAATSASNASTSETNAGTSETNAATSASNASTSETNAGTSETNAAASAVATAADVVSTNNDVVSTNADVVTTGIDAAAASVSASNASTSETNAATSETNAGTSETNAAASAAAAQVAKIEWQGTYSGATAYVLNDAVAYSGSSYICILATTGNLPTNGTYWDVLALEGAAGAGSGDMIAATYDPTAVGGDAFAMDNMIEGGSTKILTGTERTKLSGIATAATANDSDANLKNRANHTGTQTASTISDFDTEVSNNTDVAANKSKLAGIEAGADVTDATNVNAAGAVMNSDTSTASMSFVVDEDTMTSNSATKVPTQQSVKAYVDTEVAGAGGGSFPTTTTNSKTAAYTLVSGDVNEELELGSGATADRKFTVDVSLLSSGEIFGFYNDSDYRLELEVSNTGTMTMGDRTNIYLWKGESLTLGYKSTTQSKVLARG